MYYTFMIENAEYFDKHCAFRNDDIGVWVPLPDLQHRRGCKIQVTWRPARSNSSPRAADPLHASMAITITRVITPDVNAFA